MVHKNNGDSKGVTSVGALIDREDVSDEAEINSKRLLEMEYFLRNHYHQEAHVTFGEKSELLEDNVNDNYSF